MTHIICRVCEKRAQVSPEHPALLCPLCLLDLDATAAHVTSCVAEVLRRLNASDAAWRAAVAASPAQARWKQVQAAMIGVAEKTIDPERFAQQWAKRKAEGGALAELLIAYEAHDALCAQIQRELDHWHAAQREINAAVLDMPLNVVENAA